MVLELKKLGMEHEIPIRGGGRPMKTNVTISVDKDLVGRMRELEINLSHFFEQQAMLMFQDKEMYIEVTKKGSKVHQEIKYLKKDVNVLKTDVEDKNGK